MGCKQSKKNNITIPDNYKLIKIISYNVRLIFGSPIRANKIGYFLTSNYNTIENDIICLQGIYNEESRNIIINIFKKYYPNIYIIPDINDDNNIGLLIISKYQVLNYKYKQFENNNNISECNGIICININIDNNIISIYNTKLQSDYNNIIYNGGIRKQQFKQVNAFIKDNIKYISTKTTFYKTNIHLLLGSLNIMGLNLYDNSMSDEYVYIDTEYDYLDIYKIINEKPNYLLKNRNEYIFLYLLNKISISIDSTKNYNKKNILKKIFRYYKINFVSTKISNVDYSDHYPIELIFMIKLNKLT
jgi:hypothetical protein